jgi:hypothetical protein
MPKVRNESCLRIAAEEIGKAVKYSLDQKDHLRIEAEYQPRE